MVAEHNCPQCGSNTYRVPFGDFYSDLEQLRVMDARYGGLVLGRDDDEDDIPMYVCRDGGIYHLVGLMQGGEYLMSRAATHRYGSTLQALNAEKGKVGSHAVSLTAMSSVINTNFMPKFGGLWIQEPQFIVNRYATMKHFEALERMNCEANREYAVKQLSEDG